MDISVITVSYNSKDLIVHLLESLYSLTSGVDFEVIVVDNNSKDFEKTKTELEKYNITKIIKNRQNYGFAKAANQGAKIAKGKYLLFLNPDILLLNNTLKILFDFMERTPECAICGGRLKNKNGSYTTSFGKHPDIKKTILNYLNLKTNNHKLYVNLKQLQETEYILGADFFVRKSVFNRLGGFSEKYFMYYEEHELCFKVKKQPSENKIYYVPEAKMVHLGSASIENKYLFKSYNAKSSFQYFKETLNCPAKYLYLLILKILQSIDLLLTK